MSSRETLDVFLREAADRFGTIPPLKDRLVPLPNPDQWLFNEHHFRPAAERLLSEVAHLPAASREGIMSSQEYLYQEHMLRAPHGFGEAYRAASEAKVPFDARSEFVRRGAARADGPAPSAAAAKSAKVGPNQVVSIRKGEEVRSLKYKKARPLLDEGWQLAPA